MVRSRLKGNVQSIVIYLYSLLQQPAGIQLALHQGKIVIIVIIHQIDKKLHKSGWKRHSANVLKVVLSID